jgi:hypothetical protein
MTSTGAAVAHIALEFNDGRLRPLPLPNAGLSVQDLERLAATFNARLVSNSVSSPRAESAPSKPPLATNGSSSTRVNTEREPLEPPLATNSPPSPSAERAALKPPTKASLEASLVPLENDTRLQAVVDLDTTAAMDPTGSSWPFFQSSWLRTVCRTPALLATIPGLVSRRVTVATSGDELHLSIEPQRGMRPLYGILWIVTVYFIMLFFSICAGLIMFLYFYIDENYNENHIDLFVAIDAAIRLVAYATYIVGLHVLGAPRLVSITIGRDEWRATTALRMFLGRHMWKKSVSGSTGNLRGCQVCLSSGGNSVFSSKLMCLSLTRSDS